MLYHGWDGPAWLSGLPAAAASCLLSQVPTWLGGHRCTRKPRALTRGPSGAPAIKVTAEGQVLSGICSSAVLRWLQPPCSS